MAISTAGNVGIGTTGPSGKLHVSGSSYPQIYVDDATSRTFALGVTASSFRIRDITGTADRVTIDVSGNVGIGTTGPGQKLHVVSDTTRLTPGSYPGAFGSASTPAKKVLIGWDNANDVGIISPIDEGVLWKSLVLVPNAGNVGIGAMTTPGYTLTVNGTAWVTSGAWSGSDIRWKKNITPLPLQGSLDKVMQLNPVSFNWRTDEFPDLRFSSSTQLGFIAQDVEKIIPEVVTTDNNGYKGMSYERITPVLTAAIQEQQKQIEEMKSENEKLESRVKFLENH